MFNFKAVRYLVRCKGLKNSKIQAFQKYYFPGSVFRTKSNIIELAFLLELTAVEFSEKSTIIDA